MSKHLHAVGRDGMTFGMEIETNTVAWRKFKSNIKLETVLSKWGTEQKKLTVPAIWLGAIMREAHWLVTEQNNFEKISIEGFMDERFIYVVYDKPEIERKENMRTEIVRSAGVIAAEINSIKSQTSGILEAAFTYAKRSCFEIGKRLEEAKAVVPFGEWGEWLENNVSYSVSTANDLMRIYREFGNEQVDMLTGKSDAEIFEGLSQSQMVALFGLPKALRAEFVQQHREELESGEMSTRDMKKEIKRLGEIIEQKDKDIDEAKRRGSEDVAPYKERAEAAEARAQELQLRIDELNERPVEAVKVTEVVYEPSAQQIEEIRAAAFLEADEKNAKDAEKLQAKADKAQAEVDKLKEKIKKAGEADEKKIDELEKKLAAKDADVDAKIKAAVDAATAEAKKQVRQLTAQSDPRAAKVSYCLESIGRAMADINAVVAIMNAENAGSGDQLRYKCEAALVKLCNANGWQI